MTKKKGNRPAVSKKVNEKAPDDIPLPKIEDWHALIITAVIFIIECVFSIYHTSMYQGEEGAHYMNMKAFWHDPDLVLGTWAKTGWKVLYALPVLLGKQGVLIANCLFSSFTAFFCYKTAKLRGAQFPVLAMVLLVTQPLWFYLSFKSYSEITTAFLLILAVFMHYKNRLLWTSLLLSYIVTIRQEFYPVAALYGLYLLWLKKWIPALALGVFPILYDLWGWFATGDPLYLFHTAIETAQRYKDLYPRHGFNHYFLKSYEIYGAAIIVTILAYIGLVVFKKHRIDYFIFIPLAFYFLIQCVFNIQAWKIGTSTGGNLRYLLVISPLFAVLGNIAVSKIAELKNRYFLLLFLLPSIIAIAAYVTYVPDGVGFDYEKRDWKPLIFVLLMSVVLVIPLRKNIYMYGLIVLPLIFSLIVIRPVALSGDENAAMRDFVDWCKKKKAIHRHLVVSLALFNYFYDKNPWEFPHGQEPMTKEAIEKAPIGSILVWDSHFAMKYGNVTNEYFLKQPERFGGVYMNVSENKDIAIIAYVKRRP